MTALITQCPHCRTRFRVSGLQLSAARGMVRCGACLEMFDATQHLLPDAPAPAAAPRPAAAPSPAPAPKPAPAPSAPAPAPAPAKPDTLLIHDDLDLESLELDEELSRLVREELQLSQKSHQDTPSILPPRPPTETDSAAQDESWAEELLRAEGEPIAHAQEAAPPAQAAPPAPAPRSRDSERPIRREPTIDAPDATEEPSAAPALDAVRPMRGLAPAREQEPTPLEIEDEPLQLPGKAQRSAGWKTVTWSLLTLLAAVGLLAQYTAYHFDELARIEPYRPWFERLCPQLGCTVPPLVDISQIKSSNLVVRSHPEFSGALTVDAILYNRAPFAQPFPMLELRFADINGQLVASRRFKPSEYLAGELAGKQQMPSQTPIHIALEILDPGQKAVNYSLSFHSPD